MGKVTTFEGEYERRDIQVITIVIFKDKSNE